MYELKCLRLAYVSSYTCFRRHHASTLEVKDALYTLIFVRVHFIEDLLLLFHPLR